jgi:mannosyl-3-phosphoglycerate phosphatase
MAYCTDRPVVCFLEIDDLLMTASREAYRAAASAFVALDRQNIAIVLSSGQTHGELAYITRSLRFWHPFIAEDGSAIGLPHGYFATGVPDASRGFFWDVIDYGPSYRAVRDIVSAVARRLEIDVIRLSQLDTAHAASEFGVAGHLASRAIKRSYGEVLRPCDDSEASMVRLIAALQAERLRCTRRGGQSASISSGQESRWRMPSSKASMVGCATNA